LRRRSLTIRSSRPTPGCALRGRLTSNVRARKTKNRRPSPIVYFASKHAAPRQCAQPTMPPVERGKVRQLRALRANVLRRAVSLLAPSLVSGGNPLPPARSHRPAPIQVAPGALQCSRFNRRGRPHRTRRALQSPPVILTVAVFHSRYTCPCTHWCSSQHTPCIGSAAIVSSRSRTRRSPRHSLAMVVCAFSPATRSNHSVKPTRSGLRPPRAAYLKRWGTQIPS